MISPLLRLPFIFSLVPSFSSAWAHQSPPLRSNTVSFMSKSSGAEEVLGRPQLKILGVCGGIGSGKSTACKLLVSELNCAAHIGKYSESQSQISRRLQIHHTPKTNETYISLSIISHSLFLTIHPLRRRLYCPYCVSTG
jgi:hypothetical protein